MSPSSRSPSDVQARIAQAIYLQERGQLPQAALVCQEVLQQAPENCRALHLLGTIAAQSNQAALAVELIERAVTLQPEEPLYHVDLANILAMQGLPLAALASYDRALVLHPELAIAHFNRANALRELRSLEAAVASYDRAIANRPDYAEAYCNRGVVLQEMGQLDAALASIDAALSLKPQYARGHLNRGLVLQRLGQPEAALQDFDQAIRLTPAYPLAHFNRGNVLQELERLEAALESYDRTIELRADFAEAWCARGLVLQKLQRLDAGLASYDRALSIKPDLAQAHCYRGNVLRQLGRFEEAIASFERAISLDPESVDAHANRGLVLYSMQRPQAAVDSFDRALALNPGLAEVQWNRALALLLGGDFERGWSAFEWRWRNPHLYLHDLRGRLSEPYWLGEEPLPGKTILLQGEQGLGDILQFCRYVPLVAAMGARVILEVPAQLATLLANLEGVTQLVTLGEELPAVDFSCSLMSLPAAFGTRLATIPGQIPYLHCGDAEKLFWKEKLGQHSKFRVGLVWSGGSRPHQPELRDVNERRNIPLEKLAPLANIDAEFYSLQKGEPAVSELAAAQSRSWNGPRLVDFTPLLSDFSVTAGLIENLDLVITVDTAIAHLAGALGKPVWILNRFDTCWRWLLERTDSPWYPTVKLYRQASPGDWDEVIRRVRTDLVQLASRHRG
jgi:tetratricopeptide (TPR) repeat protein